MNYKSTIILIIVLVAIVLGINFFFQGEKIEGPVDNPPTDNNLLVGNDRDEHGCIGLAGYVWCEAKAECLRPWEEQWDDSCGAVPSPMNTGIDGGGLVACTMDAKICSDGSAVGRRAPNCEFEKCPDEISQ